MKKLMHAQLTKQLMLAQAMPRAGWIQLIRQALCMSTRQLAQRLRPFLKNLVCFGTKIEYPSTSYIPIL